MIETTKPESELELELMQLILGSSSPYRKALLEKLGLPFICFSPDIDESHQAGETPIALVERLAIEKARETAKAHPDALIIGSDQVAVLDDNIIGKPHNHEQAVAQLQAASGREVHLYTGLCLYNADTKTFQHSVESYSVVFRDLSDKHIESYLKKDQPYNCAGSLKAERLGIAMLSKLQGNDPNTLIGLPLIRLVDMLLSEGVDPILW
jgi:septum formation protein